MLTSPVIHTEHFIRHVFIANSQHFNSIKHLSLKLGYDDGAKFAQKSNVQLILE